MKVKNRKIENNQSRAYKTNAKMHFQSKISPKSKKPQFQAILGQNLPKKFFSKIGLHHILRIAILHHCAKNQKKQIAKFREKSKKPKFQAILGPNLPKKFFFENRARSNFEHCYFASLCKKSEKTKDKISRKVQKTQILGHFGPKFAQKKFFLKIKLGHILGIVILHHCAKNQ